MTKNVKKMMAVLLVFVYTLACLSFSVSADALSEANAVCTKLIVDENFEDADAASRWTLQHGGAGTANQARRVTAGITKPTTEQGNSEDDNAVAELKAEHVSGNTTQFLAYFKPNTVLTESNYIAEAKVSAYSQVESGDGASNGLDRFGFYLKEGYYFLFYGTNAYLSTSEYPSPTTDTAIKKTATLPSGFSKFDWHTYKFVVMGNTITAYIDSNEVLTYTDESIDTAAADFRLYGKDQYTSANANGGHVYFDDVKIWVEPSEAEKLIESMNYTLYESNFEDGGNFNPNWWTAATEATNAYGKVTTINDDGKDIKVLDVASKVNGPENDGSPILSYAKLGDADWDNYVIDVEMKATSANTTNALPEYFGITFRGVNSNGKDNFLAFGYTRKLSATTKRGLGIARSYNDFISNDGWASEMTNAGTLGFKDDWKDLNNWNRYRIVVNENKVTAYVNNTLISTYTIPENTYTHGAVGIANYTAYDYNAHVYVKSIKVSTLPPDKVAVAKGTASVNEDSKASIYARVQIPADYAGTGAKLIALVYDKDSKTFEDVISHDITIDKTKLTDYTLTSKALAAEKDYSLKLFLWDGFKGLKPLTSVKVLNDISTKTEITE